MGVHVGATVRRLDPAGLQHDLVGPRFRRGLADRRCPARWCARLGKRQTSGCANGLTSRNPPRRWHSTCITTMTARFTSMVSWFTRRRAIGRGTYACRLMTKRNSALRTGRNVIAIHGRRRERGQYIDAGLGRSGRTEGYDALKEYGAEILGADRFKKLADTRACVGAEYEATTPAGRHPDHVCLGEETWRGSRVDSRKSARQGRSSRAGCSGRVSYHASARSRARLPMV